MRPKPTDCLNGLRVLAMAWIILGHTFLMPEGERESAISFLGTCGDGRGEERNAGFSGLLLVCFPRRFRGVAPFFFCKRSFSLLEGFSGQPPCHARRACGRRVWLLEFPGHHHEPVPYVTASVCGCRLHLKGAWNKAAAERSPWLMLIIQAEQSIRLSSSAISLCFSAHGLRPRGVDTFFFLPLGQWIGASGTMSF